MFCYSCFGLSGSLRGGTARSPPGAGEPDIVIRLGTVSRAPRQATTDEEIAIHERGGAFHIKQGREIILDPPLGVDPVVLRLLLMGRMMAYLLRQRGWLPLHASGVELEGQAVLFLGSRGSGKSTAAAAFHARGHQVVTDDVGAVRVVDGGQCLLRPAGPRIRLLDDSRVAFNGVEPKGVLHFRKRLFDLTRGEQRELIATRRIYALEYGDEIRCERIPTMSAVAELSAHSFVEHGRMTEAALDAHLRDCISVARAAPLYRLFRPRSLAVLPDLVRWVEVDIAKGP